MNPVLNGCMGNIFSVPTDTLVIDVTLCIRETLWNAPVDAFARFPPPPSLATRCDDGLFIGGGLMLLWACGGTHLGKTHLARTIKGVIPKSVILSLDNYLDATRSILDSNFDDFRLLDFELLVKNIQDLKAGKSTATPLYDFRKSGRYAWKTFEPPESKLVIVEGTYALHAAVRGELDLTVAISGGVHYDLIKRVMRDVQRTGQTPEEALAQITQTVYPMFKAFIEPDLRSADIRVRNAFNPMASLVTPLYTLKSEGPLPKHDKVRAVLIKAAGADPASVPVSPRRERYYDIYLRQHDTDPEDCKDWIRVRNNKGVYSVTFSENIRESEFVICPRVDFVVSARILGGLMGLGYKIGAMLHRTTEVWEVGNVVVNIDHIRQINQSFVQVKGNNRVEVQAVANALGLAGKYIPHPYIEVYQAYMKARANSRSAPAPPMELPVVPGGSNAALAGFLAGTSTSGSSASASTGASNKGKSSAITNPRPRL